MRNIYTEFKHVLESELLEGKYQSLLNSPIETVQELEKWLADQSQLYAEVMETTIGHSIAFNLDSNDQQKKQRMMNDKTQIEPLVKKYTNLLDKRLLDHPLINKLNKNDYGEYIRRKKNAIDLFQEENIEKESEIERFTMEFIRTISSIKVSWEDQLLPEFQLQGALASDARNRRKDAWLSIQNAHYRIKDGVEEIFQTQFRLRHEVANQAGFHNYRDYSFKKLERLDYTAEDCKHLAENIRKHVVPVKAQLDDRNRNILGVDSYGPWDVSAPLRDHTPKYPFTSTQQLIDRGLKLFKQIDPALFEMAYHMKQHHYYDVEPRNGKTPGAFCLPLLHSGHSFLVMNVNGSYQNIRTFIHEMGHSFHNMLMKEQKLSLYRIPQMEIAEFASLSLEYLTLDFWWEFYQNDEDYRKAKKMQLEGFISFLSSGIVIDLFQHWLYENPNHTVNERNNKFVEMAKQFYASSIDYTGMEHYLENRWRAARHVFESPFYSIEYIIANIAAMELYRQSKIDKEGTFARYKKALSLGSSKSMKEVYETAGVSLQVTEEQLERLVEFVKCELNML